MSLAEGAVSVERDLAREDLRLSMSLCRCSGPLALGLNALRPDFDLDQTDNNNGKPCARRGRRTHLSSVPTRDQDRRIAPPYRLRNCKFGQTHIVWL